MGKKRKTYKVNGVVLDLKMPLSNGLIVNSDMAKKMVEEFNRKEQSIKRLGELNHDVKVFGEDLCNVSYAAERLCLDGDKIKGTGILLVDPVRDRSVDIKEIIERATVHFAPRMIGDADNVDLISFDMVPVPIGKEPIKHVE